MLPAHGRDLPDLRGAARRDGVGGVRPGQRPALRALRRSIPASSRSAAFDATEASGRRAEHGLDADGLTFACATTAEARVAGGSGAPALVGLGARQRRARGAARLVRASPARCATASPSAPWSTRRASSTTTGAVLWEGGPLGVAGAGPATILAADAIVDDPAERARAARATGADAVDIESRARSRAAAGSPACVRAVSDTPARPLDGLADGVRPDGDFDCARPRRGLRRARRAARPRRARRALGRASTRPEAVAMSKRVLLAAPRSFCAGVDRAIEIVERLLEQHGPPVYVRHQIVHNEHVVRRLEAARRRVRRARGRDPAPARSACSPPTASRRR